MTEDAATEEAAAYDPWLAPGRLKPGEIDPRWVGRVVEGEHWHFHRQLLARYGVVLQPGEFSEMIRAIRRFDVVPIEIGRDGRATIAVWLERLSFPILVVAAGERIVTALPLPSDRQERKRAATRKRRAAARMEEDDDVMGDGLDDPFGREAEGASEPKGRRPYGYPYRVTTRSAGVQVA